MKQRKKFSVKIGVWKSVINLPRYISSTVQQQKTIRWWKRNFFVDNHLTDTPLDPILGHDFEIFEESSKMHVW